MKTIRLLTSLALITFLFSACEDDVLDINLDFSLDETFAVNVSDDAETIYNSVQLMNPTENGDISSNLDKIKT